LAKRFGEQQPTADTAAVVTRTVILLIVFSVQPGSRKANPCPRPEPAHMQAPQPGRPPLVPSDRCVALPASRPQRTGAVGSEGPAATGRVQVAVDVIVKHDAALRPTR